MITPYVTRRRVRGLVALVLALGLMSQLQRARMDRQGDLATVHNPFPALKPNQAFAAPLPSVVHPDQPTIEERAAADPHGFFQELIDRYDRSVRDYACVFSKQERLQGKLSEAQTIEAMFREQPFSVRMKWLENADKCDRVLYVQKQWLSEQGEELAVVEPGAIARLFVPYVMRPIHGEDARKSSRRTIDQFGLRNSLVLSLEYALKAREQNVGDFRYTGTGLVDGRPTLTFERHLPFTGDESVWPDRVLVVHVDREWLMPVECTSYADDAKQQILGRYAYSKLQLNLNLPDSTFTKSGMGL